MKIKKSEASTSSQSIQNLRRSSRISMKRVDTKGTNIAMNAAKKIKKIQLNEEESPKKTQHYETDNDGYSSFSENEIETSSKISTKRKSKKLCRRQPSYKEWQQNEILRRMHEEERCLRLTINEVSTRYAEEKRYQEMITQNYREQQNMLWRKVVQLQNNHSAYRSLMGSLQSIIDGLKNRLTENGIDIENRNENYEEFDNEE